jgi:hypothetical protein
MPDYSKLIADIEAHTGGRFRRAESAALDQLRAFKLPDSVVSFFRDYEPTECIEGQVRLWPIAEMLRENRDYVPGADVSPHGFVVFATTICGDTYCFDINATDENGEPGIVLVSHDDNFEGMPPEQIKTLAKPIARNLAAFLEMFLSDSLDEDCIYS